MQPDDIPFDELLQQFRAGSKEAASRLVELCRNHVQAAVRHQLHPRLRSIFDLDDFSQEVWMIFCDRCQLRPFDNVQHLRCFLQSVARLTVLRARRKYQKETAQTVPLPDSHPAACPHCGPDLDPFLQALAQDEWEALLRGQPAVVRFILDRRRAGVCTRDIAGSLGLTQRAVQRLVHSVHGTRNS